MSLPPLSAALESILVEIGAGCPKAHVRSHYFSTERWRLRDPGEWLVEEVKSSDGRGREGVSFGEVLNGSDAEHVESEQDQNDRCTGCDALSYSF